MTGSKTSGATPEISTMWTIGHSTRSIEEFIGLLKSHGITLLVDVRRFPASRRYPHFNGTDLARSLDAAGIASQHMPTLGGRRPGRPDSGNLGWRNAGFRGYADYMQTDEFQRAIEELMAYGTSTRKVIMCAEAGYPGVAIAGLSPTRCWFMGGRLCISFQRRKRRFIRSPALRSRQMDD